MCALVQVARPVINACCVTPPPTHLLAFLHFRIPMHACTVARTAMALAQCDEVRPMLAFQVLHHGDCLGVPMVDATLQIVVVVELSDSIVGPPAEVSGRLLGGLSDTV